MLVLGGADHIAFFAACSFCLSSLQVDEVWAAKKEKEDKKRKKEENAAYNDIRGTGSAVAARKSDKKKDDVEVEGQGLMLFDDEEVTDEVKPRTFKAVPSDHCQLIGPQRNGN